MEHVEQEFLRSLGLSVSLVWEGEYIGFPRVSAGCDYLSPVTFQDVMDIGTRHRQDRYQVDQLTSSPSAKPADP